MSTSSPRGLSSAEAERRAALGEGNRFVAAPSRSWAGILRANLLTRFNAVVVGCFLLLLVIGRWQDALFGASAIANAVIGSVQEARAKRALDRVALVAAPTARVLRDGTARVIPAGSVVRGDTLVLLPGDQLAVDAEVVEATALQADESLLSGESEPVDKAPGDELLSGSLVSAGEGLALVTRVGADSYANRYAAQARRFSLVRSELRAGVNRVLTWVSWAALPLGLLVLNSQVLAVGGWAGILTGDAWRAAAVGTIASVIAFIPLGLVLMTSIAFALGALRLARQRVLVQELAAVEILARVDVICLDKTGTLTEGAVRFDAVHPLDLASHPGWRLALAWFGAQLDANATARSLATAFPAPATLPAAVHRAPFASDRRSSSATFASGPRGTWILGAVEDVLPESVATRARAGELAAAGCRVLVLAHRREDGSGRSGAEPVALLTFRERLRPEARSTLELFAREGVEVRILSGDDPRTVAAIARDAGMAGVTAVDARTLPESDDALPAALAEATVLGRVEPEQKRRIVRALQAGGRVVAMTGDGVNDILALKAADLGIAMGSGTAAARAIARVVLLDGRFAGLPLMLAEARRAMGNMERISMLFLAKTAYALGLALCFGIAALPFPLLPRQLSVTDGLTIGIPAFLLALLSDRRRYRPGYLRRVLTSAVPTGAVVAAAVGGYAVGAGWAGLAERDVRTGATIVLALSGLLVLAVLTRPVSAATIGIAAAMSAGLVLVLATPIVRDFLELSVLGAAQTMVVMGVAAGAGVAMAAVQLVLARRSRRRSG